MADPRAHPSNPFKTPDPADKTAKVMLYGGPGTGKTWTALSAPGPIAVIDSEAGTIHYTGRPGISQFDQLLSRSYQDALNAVEWLEHNPEAYRTVVVDPITLIYNVIMEGAQERRARKTKDRDADLSIQDRGSIGRKYQALSQRLINLPMNVIVIARENNLFEQRGSELKVVGVKPDAHRSAEYDFDTVLHLVKSKDGKRRAAEVVKDRMGALTEGATVEIPIVGETGGSVWESIFGDIGQAPGGVHRPTTEETVDREAVVTWGADEVAGDAMAAQIIEALQAIGQDPDDILSRFGAESWAMVSRTDGEKVLTRAAAAQARTDKAPEAEPSVEANVQGELTPPTPEVDSGSHEEQTADADAGEPATSSE